MIKAEESSSMYDFIQDDYQAPVVDKPVREVNWQASNNERFKRDLPDHVRDAMQTVQTDKSYHSFQPFAFGHKPTNSFDKMVADEFKKQFGELQEGFNFIAERERYQALYRNLMESNDE